LFVTAEKYPFQQSSTGAGGPLFVTKNIEKVEKEVGIFQSTLFTSFHLMDLSSNNCAQSYFAYIILINIGLFGLRKAALGHLKSADTV